MRAILLLPLTAALATGASVAGAGHGAGQQTRFRTGVDLVHLAVTVTDRAGRLVTDLTADDFVVTEDGETQVVRYFSSGTAGPAGRDLHLGLMLDVSESMGDDIAFTKTAAIKFLNTLPEAVDITLVDFDSEVRVSRYGQRDFVRLIERIREHRARGSTALYDAVAVYLDTAAGQTGRKVMLLYSDGGDTGSVARFGELLSLLKASDATVYSIGLLEHQTRAGRQAQRRTLLQIAETTGGEAFFPLSVRGLDSVYERLLAEIRAQYTLGYLSTNGAADGTWRQVDIKLVGPGRRGDRVRARRGYYAPYRAR